MESSMDLPRIGAPATRALAAAGIHTLADLRGRDLSDIAAMHGVGPRAITLLQQALDQRAAER